MSSFHHYFFGCLKVGLQIEKWAEDMNRHFIEKEIEVASVNLSNPKLQLSLGCVSVLSCFSGVRLFVTFWLSLPAFSSMGLSQHECWNGLPCPPLGDLPNLGIKPVSLMSLALAGGFFTTIFTWEAHHLGRIKKWYWFWRSEYCYVLRVVL